MIHDLDASDRTELEYDLVIVGSGPAGVTLANELAGSGLAVAVLESGRERPTPYGDRLRRVASEGIRIKPYSRERVLGGASSTWAGLSSPLDPIDLGPRPWLPHGAGGWPLAREELSADYAAAAERYRFPPLDVFERFRGVRGHGGVAPEWEALEEKVFLASAEPQRFGKEWRAAFEDQGTDLWLDATLLALEGSADGARAERGRVRTSGGRAVVVRARAFVLATGGIENARLLLASRAPWASGLGNERDQVGRHLMNHPKNYRGVLHLARPVEDVPYYFGCLFGCEDPGWAGYAGLRLTPEQQRERGLLNCYVRMEPLFPWSDNQGVEALVLFVKRSKGLLTRWRRRQKDSVITLRDYSETGDDTDLQNERHTTLGWLGLGLKVALNAPRVAQYLWFRLTRAKPRIRRVRLRNFMEMEPDPTNRVLLGEERDEHGQPVPLVRHRPSARDRGSLLALHAALARELEAAGLGRFESDLDSAEPWPIDQDASHHMGTTRMGTDPATSVVDPELRVHGVENVWLAGASVFPTSGCANPTFTIVALSIRLARHLRAALGAAEEAA